MAVESASAVEPAESAEPELHAQQVQVSQTLSAPRLAGYEVLGIIGAGRYGVVWRAIETQTQAVVAIKRLRQQPVGRSREESDKLAQLSSARGIVALRKFHLDDEPYCYVMEHMFGGTLAEEIRSGPLPFARAWDVFKQLTAGLAFVHKDAIVHCDLKPANVLLDTRGNPRIGDFGQARGLGPGGSSLGTRFYMPPEQAEETEPDTRWDVYALGAIFHEMLTGTKPRYDEKLDKRLGTGTSSGTEVRKHLEEYARHLETCPRPMAHRTVPGVDASIARLIDRCLAVDFEARPRDAAAVEQLIRECENDARIRKLNRFGFWLPGIMLLVVGVVALIAGSITLGQVNQSWTTHVQESNGAVAEAIAISMQSRFDSRLGIVQDESRRFVDMLRRKPTTGDSELRKQLEELQARREGRDYKWLPRWSLANDNGILIDNFGRLPDGGKRSDEKSNGKNFAWRGWFNGIEDSAKSDVATEQELAAFRSRKGPFVSQPYVREGGDDFPVINFSCPVMDTDGAPLGVLGGQLLYKDFIADVDKFADAQADKRSIVIVNGRRQVIYDAALSKAAKEMQFFVVNKVPDRFQFDEVFARASSAPYRDETLSKTYLSSSHPLKLANGQAFAVIVQQDRNYALAPLFRIQWMAIGTIVALIGVGGLCLCINVLALKREAAAYV